MIGIHGKNRRKNSTTAEPILLRSTSCSAFSFLASSFSALPPPYFLPQKYLIVNRSAAPTVLIGIARYAGNSTPHATQIHDSGNHGITAFSIKFARMISTEYQVAPYFWIHCSKDESASVYFWYHCSTLSICDRRRKMIIPSASRKQMNAAKFITLLRLRFFCKRQPPDQ